MPSFKCGGCGTMLPKPDIYWHVLKTRGDKNHPGKPIKNIGLYSQDIANVSADVEAFKARIAELETQLEAEKAK